MQRLYGDGNMALFRDKYRIESARLKGWDYRSAGHYFVTICTRNREHFFGEVAEGDMRLSPLAKLRHNSGPKSRPTTWGWNWTDLLSCPIMCMGSL